MRYLINMDYSADLPINTMGRRIRTRLYFTSESHLHTVLNVLRFAKEPHKKSILSPRGHAITNSASGTNPIAPLHKLIHNLSRTTELCYLTQIVMRVFEDSRFSTGDPRRFRVEILFSPGATATPFHLDGDSRDSDLSRVQTAPLQQIGRDDLTCQELEQFLEHAIMAGRIISDDHSQATMGTMGTMPPPDSGSVATHGKKLENHHGAEQERDRAIAPIAVISEPASIVPSLHDDLLETSMDDCLSPMYDTLHNTDQQTISEHAREKILTPLEEVDDLSEGEQSHLSDTGGGGDNNNAPLDRSDMFRRIMARKKFWSMVAIGSFAVGIACLSYAFRRVEQRRPQQRRWSSQQR
jgi:Histidine phosphatase superfamily (branch 2)